MPSMVRRRPPARKSTRGRRARPTPGASGVSRRGVLLTIARRSSRGLVIWLVAPLHEAAGYALRATPTACASNCAISAPGASSCSTRSCSPTRSSATRRRSRRGAGLRLRLLAGAADRGRRLAALGARHLRGRPLRGPAAALPAGRGAALRERRTDGPARRRARPPRGAAGPGGPVQPDRLRRGCRRRAAVALRVDHGGRLPAAHERSSSCSAPGWRASR